MNVGTEQIKYKILRALKKHKAVLRGIKYGEFADDLSEEIFELIGGEMLEMDLMHNIPTNIMQLIRKLERGLGGYKFPRDEQALEVYRWILEQPEKELKTFITWATELDRIQYVGKYRNNPLAIQFDWEQARPANTVTVNDDGSFNV